jgi:beta-ribofuranosylaminobenzene 5'-phosphate synthase
MAPLPPLRDDEAQGKRMLRLHAPGRLHLGFLDPAGTLGRRFGSLGLVIEGFETALELKASARHQVTASTPAAQAEIERASAHLHTLRERTGRTEPLHLHLHEVLPAHAGFGSGTQMALAVGRAFSQWHGLNVPTLQLARWLERGLRSGVGISGFDQGGLLLDGGPGADGTPAPLVSRLELPAAWRVIVVTDAVHQGLSGAAEKRALAILPPLPQAAAADICHQVLMRVLPGAASGDFAAFAAGVSAVQHVLGMHFAPAQDGRLFSSKAVGDLVQWLGEQGPAAQRAGIGQSSWGPTGFAIVPTADIAATLIQAAQRAGRVGPGLQLHCVAARHHGASIVDQTHAGALTPPAAAANA